MLKSIIDSNDFFVYRGDTRNEKYSTVLAIAGNTAIDGGDVPSLEKPKWDGSQWVKGESELEEWEQKMRDSDSIMFRIWEHYFDLNGTTGWPSKTIQEYNDKKALRATKP